jgi:hypothetical protein
MRTFLSSSPLIRSGLATMALIIGAVGCQSDHPPSARQAGGSNRAVISWGPHGAPAAVFVRSSGEGPPVVLSKSGDEAQACSGCRSASAEYFRTGVLPPTCHVCGNKLAVVAARD